MSFVGRKRSAAFGTRTIVGQGCGTFFFGALGVGGLVLAGCSWLMPLPGMIAALAAGPALAAGMATLAAAWGYLGRGDAIDAWGADAVIAEPADLLRWLEVA